MRIDLNGFVILLISGTASIDEQGRTVYVGDLRALALRDLRLANKLSFDFRRESFFDIEGQSALDLQAVQHTRYRQHRSGWYPLR